MTKTQEAITKLALSTDTNVILCMGYFYQQLLKDITSDSSELINKIDSSFLPTLPFRDLQIVKDINDEYLNEVDSISAARSLLYQFAASSQTSTTVIDALENWPDVEKSNKTLKFGTVASLLLLVVATEFEYKSENIHIHKHPVSTEQIKALSEILNKYTAVSSNTGSNLPKKQKRSTTTPIQSR